MTKNNWTILLFNCQGLKKKLGLVQLLANDMEADVVCLHETNNTNSGLVNYNSAGKTKVDRKMLGTGTMTFVKANRWYETIREVSIPKCGAIVGETPMATVTNLKGYVGERQIN